MIVVVNGCEEERECANLEELWTQRCAELDIAGSAGFAMALNGRLVRRPQWGDTPISDGDRVEIVRAFAGG